MGLEYELMRLHSGPDTVCVPQPKPNPWLTALSPEKHSTKALPIAAHAMETVPRGAAARS